MILGYILICGMGPLEPGAINGCRTFYDQFPDVQSCEARQYSFIENTTLRDDHYIDDVGCFTIGTEV